VTQRTRIHLLRHGQVEGHGEARYNGQRDVALTDLGREQSLSFAQGLSDKELRAIYCSDLQRCRVGAEAIAAFRGLRPTELADLRELHIGKWEGLTWKEIQKRWPDEWQGRLDDLVHFRVPEGESLLQLAARVRPAITDIVSRHRGEEVAVVAHGGVNRVILLDAIGAPLDRLFHLEQDYGCRNIIDYFDDGYVTVRLVNG